LNLSTLALLSGFGGGLGTPATMGYPSLEGVSPGLTAAPAGPSPGPGPSVASTAPTATAPQGPAAISQDAQGLASEMAALSSELGSPASAYAANQDAATNTANVAPPATVTSAQTQAGGGGITKLLMDILGLSGGPTSLAQLAQMAGGGRG
jgi:hypothetical protein